MQGRLVDETLLRGGFQGTGDSTADRPDDQMLKAGMNSITCGGQDSRVRVPPFASWVPAKAEGHKAEKKHPWLQAESPGGWELRGASPASLERLPVTSATLLTKLTKPGVHGSLEGTQKMLRWCPDWGKHFWTLLEHWQEEAWVPRQGRPGFEFLPCHVCYVIW